MTAPNTNTNEKANDWRTRTKPWTVLVVDDHPTVSAGVMGLIEDEEWLTCIGHASDGEQAIAMAWDRNPDLVVMDIQMPKLDGIQATERIKAQNPKTPVMLLTGFNETEKHYRAILAGADEYMLKDQAGDELIDGMFGVLKGEAKITESVMRAFRRLKTDNHQAVSQDNPPPHILRRWSEAEQQISGLTGQEKNILVALADCKTNPEIGREFHIELSTVKKHCENIFRKLGVSGRMQAARLAVDWGLGTPVAATSPAHAPAPLAS